MKGKIFIATSSFATFSDEPLKLMDDTGFTYKTNNTGRKLDSLGLISFLSDFSGIIAGTESYNKKILKSLPNLKVISRLGVGMDNIDLDFANEKKIKIFKTQTSPALAVSELTLGLILNLLRKINYHHKKLNEKRWEKNMGELLSNKTIGIIGLGTIGKNLVNLISGFNNNILAYDLIEDRSFQKKKILHTVR